MDSFLTIVCVMLALVVGGFVWKTYEEIQRKRKQKEMINKSVKWVTKKFKKM